MARQVERIDVGNDSEVGCRRVSDAITALMQKFGGSAACDAVVTLGLPRASDSVLKLDSGESALELRRFGVDARHNYRRIPQWMLPLGIAVQRAPSEKKAPPASAAKHILPSSENGKCRMTRHEPTLHDLM